MTVVAFYYISLSHVRVLENDDLKNFVFIRRMLILVVSTPVIVLIMTITIYNPKLINNTATIFTFC